MKLLHYIQYFHYELNYRDARNIIQMRSVKTDKSVATFDQGNVSNSKQVTSKHQTCY